MINLIPLGEVAKVRNGYAFSSSSFQRKGIPIIRMSDLKDLRVDIRGAAKVSEQFLAELPDYRISKGDLIIGMSGSIGKVAVYDSDLPALQNQRIGVFKIKDSNALDYDYLKFFSLTLEAKVSGFGKGVAVKNISGEEIESLPINLPPVSRQKHIASILGKADRLRCTRRYAQQLSDTLLQSIFLEMFGDPVKNPKGFPIEELGDSVSEFEGGVNFSPVSEDQQTSQWRVLKISAVTWGEFNPYESKAIHPNETFNNTLIVKKGDLLISRANTTELVGAVCMVRTKPPKVLLPDKIWRIRFIKDSKLEPEYVLLALRQSGLRKIIGDLATGSSGSMKNISKVKAASLPIPIAPLPLQKKFVSIVQRFEPLRAQQREATRQADHLFQTLLHRAFRGDL